ncbi:hypothetical protein CRG98_015004 [Punica granatum]|uniref:Uncharacterized protein n=1 Tax=Punica granatum TaxID=22663 RepID=A0A2I0K7Q8_PUNGR|nr:hypothetical protein CRG98_015004 [Punica granatum]
MRNWKHFSVSLCATITAPAPTAITLVLQIVPQAYGIHRVCDCRLKTPIHGVEHPCQNCRMASLPAISERVVLFWLL